MAVDSETWFASANPINLSLLFLFHLIIWQSVLINYNVLKQKIQLLNINTYLWFKNPKKLMVTVLLKIFFSECIQNFSEYTFWLSSLLVWKKDSWSSWGHISSHNFSFIYLKKRCQIFKKKSIKYRSEFLCYLSTTNIQRKTGYIAMIFLENS